MAAKVEAEWMLLWHAPVCGLMEWCRGDEASVQSCGETDGIYCYRLLGAKLLFTPLVLLEDQSEASNQLHLRHG